MIIVADASVLVAELIRERGWILFRDAGISLFVAVEQWSETDLTEDHDFLGCGVATWTFVTLRDELAHGGSTW